VAGEQHRGAALRLSREFLAFVLAEMADLDRRWAVCRAELGLAD